MKYDEALKRWGASKIGTFDWENVNVDFDIDEGYACCGGSDPNCYCSFAESPSFDVNVTYKPKGKGKRVQRWSMSLQYSMEEFLEGLFEVSE